MKYNLKHKYMQEIKPIYTQRNKEIKKIADRYIKIILDELGKSNIKVGAVIKDERNDKAIITDIKINLDDCWINVYGRFYQNDGKSLYPIRVSNIVGYKGFGLPISLNKFHFDILRSIMQKWKN